MPNTMALDDVQTGERTDIYVHKVTLTGAYVQAIRLSNTGELLVPNAASNPKALPRPGASHYDRAYPLQGPAGFACRIVPGADDTHWLLQIFGTTPGTELAAGAYAAGVLADVDFFVVFEAKNYK